MIVSRRIVLGALAACACSKRSEGAPAVPAPEGSRTRTRTGTETTTSTSTSTSTSTTVDGGSGVRTEEWDLGARGHAVVLVAPAANRVAGDKYPLVIALHGRGESLKGPVRGPWGWPRDYSLTRAAERVVAPPLTRGDYENLVTDERLARVNERLEKKPFGGLVVVCPFLPDFDWRSPPTDLVHSYGRFVTEELIPKARRELPVIAAAASTGIDGVSLGGAMGLRVGFRFAEHFGAVGSLQCALNPGQVDELVALARVAKQKNPKLAIRVATSKDDAFVNSNHALAQALAAAGTGVVFEDHLGPHDYPWNRGPGSYELLLFHDGALGR